MRCAGGGVTGSNIEVISNKSGHPLTICEVEVTGINYFTYFFFVVYIYFTALGTSGASQQSGGSVTKTGVEVSSGTCESNGYTTITSASDCETYGVALLGTR